MDGSAGMEKSRECVQGEEEGSTRGRIGRGTGVGHEGSPGRSTDMVQQTELGRELAHGYFIKRSTNESYNGKFLWRESVGRVFGGVS